MAQPKAKAKTKANMTLAVVSKTVQNLEADAKKSAAKTKALEVKLEKVDGAKMDVDDDDEND